MNLPGEPDEPTMFDTEEQLLEDAEEALTKLDQVVHVVVLGGDRVKKSTIAYVNVAIVLGILLAVLLSALTTMLVRPRGTFDNFTFIDNSGRAQSCIRTDRDTFDCITSPNN